MLIKKSSIVYNNLIGSNKFRGHFFVGGSNFVSTTVLKKSSFLFYLL